MTPIGQLAAQIRKQAFDLFQCIRSMLDLFAQRHSLFFPLTRVRLQQLLVASKIIELLDEVLAVAAKVRKLVKLLRADRGLARIQMPFCSLCVLEVPVQIKLGCWETRTSSGRGVETATTLPG